MADRDLAIGDEARLELHGRMGRGEEEVRLDRSFGPLRSGTRALPEIGIAKGEARSIRVADCAIALCAGRALTYGTWTCNAELLGLLFGPSPTTSRVLKKQRL